MPLLLDLHRKALRRRTACTVAVPSWCGGGRRRGGGGAVHFVLFLIMIAIPNREHFIARYFPQK